MTQKQGKLKYSKKDKSWYILQKMKNNSIKRLNLNEKILDIDVKLSNFFIPCAVNLEEGSIHFAENLLNLDSCFDYEIILYIPWRIKQPEEDFDIPF